nr:TonB-dependent receptor [Sphingobium lactosutens]
MNDQRARGVRKVALSIDPASNREFWGIANTTTIDFGRVTLKNIAAYRSSVIESRADLDGTFLQLYDNRSDTNVEQYSNELQLLGKALDDKLDWIFGGFYLRTKPGGVDGSVNFDSVIPGETFRYTEVYNDAQTKAIFGQVGYDIGRFLYGLRFNAGLRYTWDKSSGCTISTSLDVPRVGPGNCEQLGGATGAAKSDAGTYTLGLDYKVNDDLFFYLTNRRGYRSGGFNQSGLSAFYDGFEGYDPESVTDYEVGLKSSFRIAGMRTRMNVAAYTSSYSNIQRTIFPGPNFDGDNNPANDPLSLNINAAKATIKGVEFDFSATPARGLSINGFGAYTHAKFDEFSSAPAFIPLLGNNPVNNKFAYTPKWTLGGGVRYSTRLGDFADLVMNAIWFHSSRVWYVDRPLDTNGIQDRYDTVDARVSLQDISGKGVDVSVFVRNLFDTEYAAAGGVITPQITSATVVYNEPRVFGLQIRFTR